MKLSEILKICSENETADFRYSVVCGDTDVDVTGITSDSRKMQDGYAFVCIKGAVSDGHKYIDQIKDKASVIVVLDGEYEAKDCKAAVVSTDNTRLALALMSAAVYGNPDKKLFTIGITGTKGKTTTTYMVKNVLEACGIKTGLIGTIETIIGDEAVPAHNTTPESIEIHQSFAKMVDAGCKAVVMEVSSQGLKLDRTAGIMFDIGVFTNLEPDHIGPNEHESFEDYLNCRLSYSSSARLVLLMLMISIPKISLGEQYVRLKAMVSEIMLILRLKILNFYMNRVKLVLHMTVQDLLI